MRPPCPASLVRARAEPADGAATGPARYRPAKRAGLVAQRIPRTRSISHLQHTRPCANYPLPLSLTWTYPMHLHHDHHLDDDDRLLTPREAAQMFDVRTTTVARWSREGRLPAFLTPGGHRRYRLLDARALLEADDRAETDEDRQVAEDAVRLYDQGWSIRQVAEKFGLEYSTMRRILKRNGVRFRRQGRR